MRMPDGNSAAELAHDNIQRTLDFEAWYVERLHQLRNEPGELASALENEELADLGAEFLHIGVRAPHEDLEAWRKRKAAQWSTKWHAVVDRVMEREQKEWE